MNINIIIFGAEGLAKDTYAQISESNKSIKNVFGVRFNVIGFIDEFNYNRKLFDLPVRKCLDNYMGIVTDDTYMTIAFGNPKGKKDTVLKLGSKFIDGKSIEYINIINPSTYVDKTLDLGNGNIIMGNTAISANVKIGNHICVYYQSCISHDCTIGDYSTICPGTTICGNVNIGEECFIGAGTIIKEKVNIADNVTIGAGSLVLKDIKEEGTYYGHPVHKSIIK